MEIAQILFSLLHAWGLDPDLDRAGRKPARRLPTTQSSTHQDCPQNCLDRRSLPGEGSQCSCPLGSEAGRKPARRLPTTQSSTHQACPRNCLDRRSLPGEGSQCSCPLGSGAGRKPARRLPTTQSSTHQDCPQNCLDRRSLPGEGSQCSCPLGSEAGRKPARRLPTTQSSTHQACPQNCLDRRSLPGEGSQCSCPLGSGAGRKPARRLPTTQSSTHQACPQNCSDRRSLPGEGSQCSCPLGSEAGRKPARRLPTTQLFSSKLHWELSTTLTTNHLLSIVALANTLMSMSNASFVPEQEVARRMHSFKRPQVEMLARRWQHHCLEVRDASQALLLAELGSINPHATPKEPAEKVSLTENLKTTAVVLLGVIGAEFGQDITSEGAANNKRRKEGDSRKSSVVEALTHLLLSPPCPRLPAHTPLRRAAVDLLGRGFTVWEPYLDQSHVLLGLLEMCSDADKLVPSMSYGLPLTPQADSCRTARHALTLIATAR
ncbi:Uncharacterized protein OBRU01_09383 [Operophtera brumata]|uniref:Uncharacterized protein n=1 Tax=Operophtera brumata TaxID=104452 RepID=A0A0L7LFR3_OPEBR|nr:Uncharacterized protein OBRU01_09383 [Operophtera brumata]